MSAESSAERARMDLVVMLGTWVNDCGGASRGDTGVSQVRLPLDLQFRSVVEGVMDHPCNLSD